jgi:6-phosphogluconate dehydrogenase
VCALIFVKMADLRLSNTQIEQLIEMYRAEECLWDGGHAHYLDSDLRQAALNRIADQLGRNVNGGSYPI